MQKKGVGNTVKVGEELVAKVLLSVASKLVIVDAVARLVILLLLPALVLLPIIPVNKKRQLVDVVFKVIMSE